MDSLKIKQEFNRILDAVDLPGQLESYKMVTDAAFHILHRHKGATMSVVDYEGNLLYQMTTLKCLSLLKLCEGLNYKNDIEGFTMMEMYDPFTMNGIVRSQFEAYCNFNNIFIQSKSDEEKQLKYLLWVLSGLLNRQCFPVMMRENVEKKEAERKDIEKIWEDIRANRIFSGLDAKSQKRILEMRKEDWKLSVKDKSADFSGWEKLMKNSGINEALEQQYRSLSLSSHPSNVSVFQFSDMYRNKQVALINVMMAIKLSKFFVSFFIRDYCVHSAVARQIFDDMPILHQLIINSYNRMFKGENYEINEAYKLV
jgi:hypothetical protein